MHVANMNIKYMQAYMYMYNNTVLSFLCRVYSSTKRLPASLDILPIEISMQNFGYSTFMWKYSVWGVKYTPNIDYRCAGSDIDQRLKTIVNMNF